MRRVGCTEIWMHEEGWLCRNMEARGGMAIQKYGQKYESMRRDGCTMHRNMEA
jgi:hypothetical protein